VVYIDSPGFSRMLKSVMLQWNGHLARLESRGLHLEFWYICVFIMVTVYTICGTNIPHVSLHDMFRPDGAIFRYIAVLQSPFLFLLLSPHWPVYFILGFGFVYLVSCYRFLSYRLFSCLM
jgi:hypothetical protein